jgi:hypothetical protein
LLTDLAPLRARKNFEWQTIVVSRFAALLWVGTSPSAIQIARQVEILLAAFGFHCASVSANAWVARTVRHATVKARNDWRIVVPH